MSDKLSLPDGWRLESKETEYDSRMDREYTRIKYVGSDGTELRIGTVQEYGSLDGWGFHVYTDDPSIGTISLSDSIEDAKASARSHMQDVAGTAEQ